MPYLLNIDVSGKEGFVALAEDESCQDSITNSSPMEHASFLQPAIQTLLARNKIDIGELVAIAVSNGPGSYTGLRVGLASAKGLCFALQIPLITVNSLQVLAKAASMYVEKKPHVLELENNQYRTNKPPQNNVDLQSADDVKQLLYCAMIDARRMEVFFGLYDSANHTIMPPSAAILNDDFLQAYLYQNKICFSGSGAAKWQEINQHINSFFVADSFSKEAMCSLSAKQFKENSFANLITAVPFYCKDFYSPTVKKI